MVWPALSFAMDELMRFLVELDDPPKPEEFLKNIVKILKAGGVNDVCDLDCLAIDTLGVVLTPGESSFLTRAGVEAGVRARSRRSALQVSEGVGQPAGYRRGEAQSEYGCTMESWNLFDRYIRHGISVAVHVCQYLTSEPGNAQRFRGCHQGMIHLRVRKYPGLREERDVKWFSSAHNPTNFHGRWQWNAGAGTLFIWFHCKSSAKNFIPECYWRMTRLSCFVEASTSGDPDRLYKGEDRGGREIVMRPKEKFLLGMDGEWRLEKNAALHDFERVEPDDWVLPMSDGSVRESSHFS